MKLAYRRLLPLAVMLCLGLAAVLPLAAQEGTGAQDTTGAQGAADAASDPFAEGQDPFDVDTFDQIVAEGEAQDAAARLEMQFGGNLSMSASTATTADFEWVTAGASATGKAFLKVSVPDYGAVYLAYNFKKNIVQGTGGVPPAALTAPDGLFDVSFDLAEFYLSFDLFQKVFVRVGNQLLAWGPSTIWTPVDFVNLEKADALAAFDSRVGKPGVRLTAPIGISNLILFADLAGTVTGAASPFDVNDLYETTNLAGRWDIVLAGFELGLSTYLGASVQNKYGFDFSGRLLGFDVYGELGLAFPDEGEDFSYTYSIGLQRTLGELDYWSVATEFFANSAGSTDTEALILADDFTPLYAGKYYAYAAVTRTNLGRDGISATLAGFANFSDLSFLARLSTSIRLPRLVPFTFALSWAGGGDRKEFTYFAGDNSLSTELRVSYEF
jgi:hypothetical protein